MDIKICKRFDVPSTAHTFKATHILSLVDPGVKVYTPTLCDGNHKILFMEDFDRPDHPNSPQIEQIHEALEWSRVLPPDARVIVHCEAGVSRSTAMALGVWVLHNPGKSLKDGSKWLKETRPIACPNLLIAEFIDEILNLDGEFFKACDEVGEWRMVDWF